MTHTHARARAGKRHACTRASARKAAVCPAAHPWSGLACKLAASAARYAANRRVMKGPLAAWARHGQSAGGGETLPASCVTIAIPLMWSTRGVVALVTRSFRTAWDQTHASARATRATHRCGRCWCHDGASAGVACGWYGAHACEWVCTTARCNPCTPGSRERCVEHSPDQPPRTRAVCASTARAQCQAAAPDWPGRGLQRITTSVACATAAGARRVFALSCARTGMWWLRLSLCAWSSEAPACAGSSNATPAPWWDNVPRVHRQRGLRLVPGTAVGVDSA